MSQPSNFNNLRFSQASNRKPNLFAASEVLTIVGGI